MNSLIRRMYENLHKHYRPSIKLAGPSDAVPETAELHTFSAKAFYLGNAELNEIRRLRYEERGSLTLEGRRLRFCGVPIYWTDDDSHFAVRYI